MCDFHSQSLPSWHAHTAKSLLLYVKVLPNIYMASFPKTSFVITVVTWTVHNGQLTFAIDQWKSPFYILLSLLRWLMIAWWVVKLGYLAVLLVFVFSCKMWRQKKNKVTDAWNGVEVRNACSYVCLLWKFNCPVLHPLAQFGRIRCHALSTQNITILNVSSGERSSSLFDTFDG